MILDIQKIMKEKKNREQRDSVQKTNVRRRKKEKCLSDMSREKNVLLQWYMIIEYVYC